ncbi:MAG: GNAT family N-acetyltransferase [Oscillospiraceae bacterium]
MIREAEFKDIDAVAEIFRQLHKKHVELSPESYKMPFDYYFRGRLEAFFADDDMTIIVSDNCGIDGFAVIRFFDTDSAERVGRQVCYVECFAVEETRRRQGIGTALFGYIKDYAQNCGCDCIRLGAAAENKEALQFYQKMGLVPRVINLNLNL